MTQPLRTSRLAILSLAAGLSLAAAAFAQDASTTPVVTDVPTPSTGSGTTSTGDVVQMDAFTVGAEVGAYHEEMSSMATKVPTNLKDLASSLQIMNANAMADRNVISLQDVFGYMTGVSQSQGNINGFTFRGLPVSGSYDQNIEFDGMQGTPLKKGAQSAADVADLEFLKGPNSVLYGQMHPGGLMNIVSKSPEAVERIDLKATWFTYDGAFNGFGNKNGGSATLDATGPIDSGKHLLYRMIVDTQDIPPSRPGDFDHLLSIFPSLTYAFNAQTSFTVKVEIDQDYRRQDDGIFPVFTSHAIPIPSGGTSAAYGENATYYYAPFNTVYQNTYDKARDKGDALSTAFHTEVGPWTIRFQTRSVWHQDYTQEDSDNNASVFFPKANYATPGTTIQRQYNLIINGHRWNFGDANAFGTFGPEKFQNTVMVGIGGGSEQFDNQRYGFGPNVTPAVTVINPVINQLYPATGKAYPANGTAVQDTNNRSSTFGSYVSDQAKIFDKIHLTYGLRWDQYIQTGIDLLNPVKTPYQHENVQATDQQVGVVYDVTPVVSAYASWSTSTTPNTVTDVNAQGQSGFPPETGTQYEEGLKFETPDKKLYGSICYYMISRTNVLVGTGLTAPVSGIAIFRLDGAQHSEGFETEEEWHPFPNWQVQVGGDFAKAFVASSITNPYTVGDDLANAPRWQTSFWTRYNVPNGPLSGLGFGLGVISQGKYWAGDPTTTVYFPMPGYSRVDGALYYKWKRYHFTLNVTNIGDRRYIQNEQSAEYITPGEQRKLTFTIETLF